LNSKFEPKTKASLIQLKKQLLDCKLTSPSQDPDEWIQTLEGLQRKLLTLGHEVSDMDIVIHILQNLPKEYDTTTELLEYDLENNFASLDRVKEKLRARFDKLQRSNPTQDDALIVGGSKPGKYKGLYTFCGIYGHKSSQCRKKPKGGGEFKEGEDKNKSSNSNFNKPFPFSCFVCQKEGHKASDCPLKKKNRERMDEVNVASESTDIALICEGMIDSALICNDENEKTKMTKYWVGYSGATCHMVCSNEKLIDWRSVDERITVAGGASLPVTKIAKIHLKLKNSRGKDAEVTLEDVKLVPNLRVNLFSLTLGMRKGWKLESFNELLTVRKYGQMITFDHKIPIGKSFLSCAEVIQEDKAMIVCPRKQYDFKTFHNLLGHYSIENTRKTAARLGIRLTGRISTCEDCLLSKMRRKNINKMSLGRSKVPGERFLIDISYIKRKSLGGKDT
jgi:gag-polypeptide of LTR copia-type/Zinc knuckle